MAREGARSGPSTRMLENGRNEFEFFTDDFFFMGRGLLRNNGVGASWGMAERPRSVFGCFDREISGLALTTVVPGATFRSINMSQHPEFSPLSVRAGAWRRTGLQPSPGIVMLGA